MNLKELTPIQTDLLKTLSNGIPLTRDDFVEGLEMPRTTIYDNLEKLERKKLVVRYTENNGRGRPLTLWHLSRNPLLKLLKKNEKRPDFIKNGVNSKEILKIYKKKASIRYARKKNLQKTINDKIRPQTVISDYFN